MKTLLKRPSDPAALPTDLLVVPLADGGLPPAAESLDARTGGALSRAVQTGIAKAKAGSSAL
ncbi:MAG: hypothetical protein AB1416_04725, partial [Actinomycetota bacterium]